MKELQWLAIDARIDNKTVILTFKILNNLATYFLPSLFVKYQPARLLRSSKGLLLQVPFVNTVSYKHC